MKKKTEKKTFQAHAVRLPVNARAPKPILLIWRDLSFDGMLRLPIQEAVWISANGITGIDLPS